MTNLRLFQVCRSLLTFTYRLNTPRNGRKDISIMYSTNLYLELSVYIPHSDVRGAIRAREMSREAFIRVSFYRFVRSIWDSTTSSWSTERNRWIDMTSSPGIMSSLAFFSPPTSIVSRKRRATTYSNHHLALVLCDKYVSVARLSSLMRDLRAHVVALSVSLILIDLSYRASRLALILQRAWKCASGPRRVSSRETRRWLMAEKAGKRYGVSGGETEVSPYLATLPRPLVL